MGAALDSLDPAWASPPIPAHRRRYLDALTLFHTDQGHVRVPTDFHTTDGLPLGAWIARQRHLHRRGRLDADLVHALNQHGLSWNPTAERRDAHLAACRQAVAEHGHLQLPRRYVTADGLPTGAWLTAHRHRRRTGQIDPTVDEHLDNLDPTWIGTSTTEQQTRRPTRLHDRLIAAAAAYAHQHGHLGVPANHITTDGLRLGGFVRRCRSAAAAGRLDATLATALTTMDPGWTSPPTRAHGEKFLDAAQQWHRDHGHLRVPKAHVTDTGTGLGWWMHDQRKRRRKATLAPHIGQLLDQLDPSWAQPRHGGRRTATRQDYLAALETFHHRHGHLNIPHDHNTADGLPLGRWLDRNRLARQAGKLDAALIATLDRLAIDWTPRPKPPNPRYQTYIDAMYQHLETYGHVDVHHLHITEHGLNLGRWLARQRHAHRTGTLHPTIEEELNALHVKWTLRRRTNHTNKRPVPTPT